MAVLIKKAADVASSEITSKSLYVQRRQFLRGAMGAAGALVLGGEAARQIVWPEQVALAGGNIEGLQKSPLSTSGEKLTPLKDITNYNNYYEFSTDKYEPAGLAKNFHTRPWTVKVEGFVKNSKTYDVDDIIRLSAPEERVYRHRCVEGWSMV